MRIRGLSISAAVALLIIATSGTLARAGTFDVASENEFRETLNKIRAAHFLSRTTFGPRLDDIEELADRIGQIGRNAAFEEWIDAQFAEPVTYHVPLAEVMVTDDGVTQTQASINVARYRHYAWWHNAITADDQLRQRVAWALSQILVVSETDATFNQNNADNQGNGRWLGLARFYDMLLDNSFGNYRDLLLDVTLHPIMGVYLSHVNNRKANPAAGTSPDENFGREVQQLFSIGIPVLTMRGEVVTVNGVPVETYDNEDIETFARVFTGLSYAGNAGFNGQRNYTDPMVSYGSENDHDKDEKVLHNGTVLPAGQSVMQDINGALDNLFEHPNCPPFVARRLIQRLVKSNPSGDYIERVANVFVDNGSGVRGDLQAVAKAIFLDTEAVNSLLFSVGEVNGGFASIGVQTRGTEYSRLREPVLRYTAMIRAFNATSDYVPAGGMGTPGRFMIPSQFNDMNQAPYQSPSVFNFYDVEFKPQGEILNYVPTPQIPNNELVAPEFQILTAVAANRMANQYRADVIDQTLDFRLISNNATLGTIDTDITLDFSEELTLAEEDLDELMRHLDLLLCYGALQDVSRDAIGTIIVEEADIEDYDTQVEGAVLGILTSPDCAVFE